MSEYEDGEDVVFEAHLENEVTGEKIIVTVTVSGHGGDPYAVMTAIDGMSKEMHRAEQAATEAFDALAGGDAAVLLDKLASYGGAFCEEHADAVAEKLGSTNIAEDADKFLRELNGF